MQERTRGTTTLAAGYNSSLQSVVTIVLNPLLGMFFDKFGWRMPFVSLGAACYMVVFALIGLTTVNPIGPIVLSSFALSFNILPWIGSIPLVVTNQDLIGTAYGVFSSFVSGQYLGRGGKDAGRGGGGRYRRKGECAWHEIEYELTD